MLLLDTCVLSEGGKGLRHPAVDAWFAAQDQDKLFVSSVTVGEIRYGIECLPSGRKKRALEHWFEEIIITGFENRVMSFDLASALQWGDLRAKYRHAKTVDSQIAATALAYGLTLVTRNVKDFRFDGLQVLNPWES